VGFRQRVVQSGAFFEFRLVLGLTLGEETGCFAAIRPQGFNFTRQASCASDRQYRFVFIGFRSHAVTLDSVQVAVTQPAALFGFSVCLTTPSG